MPILDLSNFPTLDSYTGRRNKLTTRFAVSETEVEQPDLCNHFQNDIETGTNITATKDVIDVKDNDNIAKFPLKQTISCAHIITKTGRYVKIIRELYLRHDISSCLTAGKICDDHDFEVDANVFRNFLSASKDLTHFLVPDAGCFRGYMELVDFNPEMSAGILFMQSALTQLIRDQTGGKRVYNKIIKLCLKNLSCCLDSENDDTFDHAKGCVIFLNEIHNGAHSAKLSSETMSDWRFRKIYQAAVWIFKHLEGLIPFVLLTDNQHYQRMFGARTPNIFVLDVPTYLKMFWPQKLPEAVELYRSLTEAFVEDASRSEFREYLSESMWQRGVNLGHYYVGNLRVNPKRAQAEAYVTLMNYSALRDLNLRLSAVNDTHSVETTVAEESSDLGLDLAVADADEDILILGSSDRNRSIHNDIVVIKVYSMSDVTSSEDDEQETGSEQKANRIRGCVVAVAQRRWRDYVCTLQLTAGQESASNTERSLAIPYDWRIPKIRLTGTTRLEGLSDRRILIRIDQWPIGSMYPCGHVVRDVGPLLDWTTEVATILLEHSLPVLPDDGDSNWFTRSQLKEIPDPSSLPGLMDLALNSGNRRDLRDSHLIFTIDPPGCEDIDDALSVRILPSGRIELGVHIADVTHFVTAGSLVDIEAASRCTSVYLPDRRIDMLPSALATNICSLWSQQDRLTVSVLWELEPVTYSIINVWYGRSVIRSSYKLEYAVAQRICDGEENVDIPELENVAIESVRSSELAQLRKAIKLMADIAHTFRRNRGGLNLESLEPEDDAEMEVSGVDAATETPDLGKGTASRTDGLDGAKQMHEMIAECMILANTWVAKRILETFPDSAILRKHPPPSARKLRQLETLCAAKEFKLDASTCATFEASLNSCLDPSDVWVNALVRNVAILAMQLATYFPAGSCLEESFAHYGLGLSVYTHFTSPIRRYADILVHRQLIVALNTRKASASEDRSSPVGDAYKGTPTSRLDTIIPASCGSLMDLCSRMNERHRAAQDAQRYSKEVLLALFLLDLPLDDPRLITEGVIYAIQSNGVSVFVPKYGLKGICYLDNGRNEQKDDGSGSPRKIGTKICEKVNNGTTIRVSQGGEHQDDSSGHQMVVTESYSVFEHVLIKIAIIESRYHAPRFSFSVLEKLPLEKSTLGRISDDDKWNQDSVLLEEVVRRTKALVTTDSLSEDDVALGPEINSQLDRQDFYNFLSGSRSKSLIL